ncbi:hypothetical protein [Mycolicibacterium vulneris]|uniref:hypothetical protein n=1 Tax=Mycolicibacterium vulneris TaxID=547163 RepID=UPI0015E8D276|nr:hypothetical protein [Mycolicibacterium vulneris]
MLDISTAGAVKVLTLSSGAVNAQDVELLEELASTVRDLARPDAGAHPRGPRR